MMMHTAPSHPSLTGLYHIGAVVIASIGSMAFGNPSSLYQVSMYIRWYCTPINCYSARVLIRLKRATHYILVNSIGYMIVDEYEIKDMEVDELHGAGYPVQSGKR